LLFATGWVLIDIENDAFLTVAMSSGLVVVYQS